MNQHHSSNKRKVTTLTRLFRLFRFFRQESGQANSINMPSSTCSDTECGGYNEAFVMQHWASYGPYHH